MGEMDIVKIRGPITRKIIECAVKKFIKKKFELSNLDLDINNISIQVSESGKANVEACFNAALNLEDILKMMG